MQDFWFRLSVPLVFGAVVALILWGIFSATAALIFVALLLLLMMTVHARQLHRLGTWLQDPRIDTMPEARGVWDEVFSRLHRMVKRHKKTKQELADELQHIEQATAALPEGVAILNEANRIEWCNPLSQEHFGLNSTHDFMQDITYLVRQPEFIEYLQAEQRTEPLILKSARHDDLILSIKLISYGGDKRLLISRDVTQLERIESMRRDFVANVSHELRTPLTVINGFVENLQDMPDLSRADAQRALQLMGEQTQRMENLVADLLTLSHLENDHSAMREENLDMRALLAEVLQEGRLLSSGKHTLQLEFVGNEKMRGNRDELRSAFGNLISNAIRYTPQGGNILLRWYTRAGQPIFAVQDSGIGIAAQHIPRLTERFYRVDRSRSRETGGTGLGLAIVKHIAIRHQATLEVQSEEGKGSNFSLVFSVSHAS